MQISLTAAVCRLVAIVLALGAVSLAQAESTAQGQDRFATVKAAAARNQAALRQYTWVETTQISYNGEVKSTKVVSCSYGADGQLHKTILSAPAAKQERGLRGRIEERKTAEIKNELESASALVHSYVPPDPGKLQAVVAAGKMQLLTAPPGKAILVFANYQLPGDALTLTFNLNPKGFVSIDVATWQDSPSKPVTLTVQFQRLPDGTTYPALSTLTVPSSNVQVMINNSDYQKLAR